MKTLIVDNYDSFTFNLFQLVAGISGEAPIVVRNDQLTWNELQALDIDSIILSPGPGHPDNDRDFGICRQIILQSHLPVLGVCLGFQGIAHFFGGDVARASEPVHGRTSRIFHNESGLFAGIPQGFSAVRYHSLAVRRPIPTVLRPTAWTSDEVPMALEHIERPLWGVQFHPESISTEYGTKLMGNFRRLARRRLSYVESSSDTHQHETNLKPPRPQPVHSETPWKVFSRKLRDCPTGEAAFCSLFSKANPTFWLDSPENSSGRFSFMGCADGPNSYWISYSTAEHRLELHTPSGTEIRNVSLFEFLKNELKSRRCEATELPFDFNGGFVGYLGYELKAECGGSAAHQSPHPDACLIFVDRLVAFDHREETAWLVYAGPQECEALASQWFDEMERRIESGISPPSPPAQWPEEVKFRNEQNHEEYLTSIRQCIDWIRAGESYEICLTNRMRADVKLCPLVYYRSLRRSNPAPNAAFLRFPQVTVACSSPERFLKIDPQGNVESRPIKGTMRRTANRADDRKLRESLRTNVKTRSENLMIVDLLRNDLGRICEVGSVHVPQMMEVETYTNLHQLVSTVRGQLCPDMTAIDCIQSAFPGAR
jgi:para-aminobenzoate synthetase